MCAGVASVPRNARSHRWSKFRLRRRLARHGAGAGSSRCRCPGGAFRTCRRDRRRRGWRRRHPPPRPARRRTSCDGLQQHRDPLGQPTCPVLQVIEVGELVQQFLHGRVVPGVGPPSCAELLQQGDRRRPVSRDIARSRSRALTLPDPSHTELTGPRGRSTACRIPPRSRCHPGTPAPRPSRRCCASWSRTSRPVARCGAVASPLVAGFGRRRRRRRAGWPALSRPPSRAPDPPATLRISGLSISSAPKADAVSATCHIACDSAPRIRPEAPSTQSRRVADTISTIVRTPRPSSPSRTAYVFANSISLEALERLPSLSLSRWIRNTLRVPSGSTRGTTKQVTPASGLGQARGRRRSWVPSRTTCARSAGSCRPRRASAVVVFGADVGAALLLRHRHTGDQPDLLRGGAQPEVVRARRTDRGSSPRSTARIHAQGRDRRVGHRDRAQVTRLDLGPHDETGRAGDMGALLRGHPRVGMQPPLHRDWS